MRKLLPLIIALGLVTFFAESVRSRTGLPERRSPRPRVTSGVPHKQIGVEAVPRLQRELMRRTYSIPGIEKRSSFTPYANAAAIWLKRNIKAAHPRAFLSGREFSHFHPDGSLHAPLPPKRAREAVKAGWAVAHPWAHLRNGWEGLVLIYTPRTRYEMEIVFQLIVDSYNFVSGRSIKASDYRRRSAFPR